MGHSSVIWKTSPFVLLCIVLIPSPAWSFRVWGLNTDFPGNQCEEAGIIEAECGDEEYFMRWYGIDIPFAVNEDAGEDIAAAGASEMTQADAEDASQASYQSWEDVAGSYLRFTYDGTTPTRMDGTDGVNTTVWFNADKDAGWEWIVDYYGVTCVTVLNTGEIVDADILMNPEEPWTWTPDSPDCAVGDQDVQGTLTHECGHSIGIAHPQCADHCSDDVTGCGGAITTDEASTMCQGNPCFGADAWKRSLTTDDEEAIICLYPDLPTLVLVDQTGSMCAGTRMADAKATASTFVEELADNNMIVAAFADQATVDCPEECPEGTEHLGYEELTGWTFVLADLLDAIDSTCPTGFTPLWESTCCAIDTAALEAPSNILVITDTGENNSDEGILDWPPGGDCSDCVTPEDVIAAASDAGVTFYVLDMTDYFASPATAAREDVPRDALTRTDSDVLIELARLTGGLYFRVHTFTEMYAGRLGIQAHMLENAKARQNPQTCFPGPYPIDHVQRYTVQGSPNSPYAGLPVTIFGRVTVRKGTYDGGTQYVQDCSGGMAIFSLAAPTAALGDSVAVTGVVSQTFGEIRLSPVSSFTILGPGLPPATAVQDFHLVGNYETVGSLVEVFGRAVGPVQDFRFPLAVYNVNEILTVFLDPDTGINPAVISVNGLYSLTGVLSIRQGLVELKPRGVEDILDVTDVSPETASDPRGLGRILAVDPNPSGSSVQVAYSVSQEVAVSVQIIDVTGRPIRSLSDRRMPPGSHVLIWDGNDDRGRRVSSGHYFIRLRLDGKVVDRGRALLLR